MISRFREQLGPAGLVVAVVALIAALAGGAIAASGGSGDGSATTSAQGPRGKQGKQGKRGPTGPTGVAGAAGAAGPVGLAGSKGDKGDAGSDGVDGTDGTTGPTGKSVTLTTEAPGTECEEGGVKVEVEGTPLSKKFVCNGEEGSPWTAGGTLPPGATLTGTWFIRGQGSADELDAAAISFPIHLTTAQASSIVIKNGGATECSGSANDPKANAGFICIYVGAFEEAFGFPKVLKPDLSEAGVGTSGAILRYQEIIPSNAYASGSFAITAPASP